MQFDYNETYQLMRKFHDLGKNETLIMDYLFKQSVAEVTYSQLAKAIGQKDMSNVRKAILNLEQMGLVNICRKYEENEAPKNSNPMIACFIVDGWMERLLYGTWDTSEWDCIRR